MKTQLSLKWKLILSIIGVWAIISGAVYGVVNNSMNDLDRIYEDTMMNLAEANANTIAKDIAFEVAAGMSDEVIVKLRSFENEMLTHAIFVLRPDKTLLAKSNAQVKHDEIIKEFKDFSKKNAKVIDNNVAALQSISTAENKIDGYIIYMKSLDKYNAVRSHAKRAFAVAAALGLIVLIVAAYFLGHSASHPIDKLVTAAQRIADGDLEGIQIETRGSLETVELGMSVKKMATAMQKQVFAIKNLTNEMSGVSRDIEGTMTNLASAASEQAAAVNETAATVEEMEKAGQSASVNANQILSAAEKAAEVSTRGRESVEKTYEIIMKIKEDSQNISDKSRNLLNAVEEVGNIIQSVNAIAEQSKILAVNASIEAAKAGEYGSGFAVVAQEVKDLAQQSKDATLQITGTLTAIKKAIEGMVTMAQRGKDRTDDGVNTIANAGAIMNDLSEAIRENSNFANVIAANINQQTVGLTQIATAIEEINATAMENQNISRSIVDGTRQMNDSFHLLTKMVDRWRTPAHLEQEDDTGEMALEES